MPVRLMWAATSADNEQVGGRGCTPHRHPPNLVWTMVSFHTLGPHPLDDVHPPAPTNKSPIGPDGVDGLAADLWQAADRGQLRLDYQPSVDLRSGALLGLEA